MPEIEIVRLTKRAQLVKQLEPQLEQLVDAHGLQDVLHALREVCFDKANHIAHTWQDVELAKVWLAAGIRVNSAAQGVKV